MSKHPYIYVVEKETKNGIWSVYWTEVFENQQQALHEIKYELKILYNRILHRVTTKKLPNLRVTKYVPESEV